MTSTVADHLSPRLAWRAWRLDGHNYLHSLHQDSVWRGYEEVQAICQAPQTVYESREVAPEDNCTCGIYSVFTPAEALLWAADYYSRFPSSRVVIGQVSLWGKIVEHEGGLRAQYAYPHDLVLLGKPDMPSQQTLEQRYGVSVEVRDFEDLPSTTLLQAVRTGRIHPLNLAATTFFVSLVLFLLIGVLYSRVDAPASPVVESEPTVCVDTLPVQVSLVNGTCAKVSLDDGNVQERWYVLEQKGSETVIVRFSTTPQLPNVAAEYVPGRLVVRGRHWDTLRLRENVLAFTKIGNTYVYVRLPLSTLTRTEPLLGAFTFTPIVPITPSR